MSSNFSVWWITFMCIHVPLQAASVPAWAWPASQDLFHTLLSSTPVTECGWSAPVENVLVTPQKQFLRGPLRGFGICASSVETCLHLGAIPRRVSPDDWSVNCTTCCARSACTGYDLSDSDNYRPVNGYCMFPKLEQRVTPSSYTANSTNITGSTQVPPISSGLVSESVPDLEEKTCLSIGGSVGANDELTYWARQCPLSGRCCLFPEYESCQTCGVKYGSAWNWSKPATARSDTQQELLAWKTAVHQMAGTGWNFGMRPMTAPGFSDNYSQNPPTYDSLVPPQLWNNFLNRPATSSMSDNDDEQDDDDDHRGWCWQAAIMSKRDGSLRCGGVLISNRYILTTATCAHFTSESFGNYMVRFGATDLRKSNEKHAVDVDIGEVFIHPRYNSTTLMNNIAVMELKSAISCNNKFVCTICLPNVNIMGFTNFTAEHGHHQWIKNEVYQCLATGWGRKTIGHHSYTPYLKEMVYAPIFNNHSSCAAEYFAHNGKTGVTDFSNITFCAVPQPSYQGKIVPTCHGDNGSPLVCLYEGQYYLTGLSWGGNRCDLRKTDLVAKVLQPNHKDEPSATNVDFFTDVVKFVPWIYGILYGTSF